MRFIISKVLLLFIVIMTTACNKNNLSDTKSDIDRKEENTSSKNKSIKDGEKLLYLKKSITIDATDFQQWVYFSFETGKVITSDNPKEDTSWDLAFRRTFTRTNSGTSGKGQGGAATTPFKDFKDLELRFLQTNPYITDTTEYIPVEFGGGNGRNVNESINKNIRGIFLSDITQMPPKIGYSDIIYFIRTAKGKYAAVLFTGYEKEISPTEPLKRGYVSFDYIYPLELK